MSTPDPPRPTIRVMDRVRHLLHYPAWLLLRSLKPRLFPDPHTLIASLSTGPPSAPPSQVPQTPAITFPIAVYAHRGGGLERRPNGRYFNENTLPAFANAVLLGADLLETDVQLTADGKVVLLHDINMRRLFGPRYAGQTVATYAYADLPPLLQSPPARPVDMPSSPQSGSAGGSRPPHQSTQLVSPTQQPSNTNSGNPAPAGPAAASPSPADLSQELPVAPADEMEDPPSSEHRHVPLLEDLLQRFPGLPVQVNVRRPYVEAGACGVVLAALALPDCPFLGQLSCLLPQPQTHQCMW